VRRPALGAPIEQKAPLWLAIADRVYVIDDGKLHPGPAAELTKNEELTDTKT
jgi:ABC-type branched-subunit amino acid transport system ATPase component